MRCVLMFAAFMVSCPASSVFGGEYVLDVSRLTVESDGKSGLADDPKSFTTESIEIDITDREDFHTRLRMKEKIITVKGRLTKTEKEGYVLEISVEYLGDVKDPDALTGIEDTLRVQTSVEVVPGEATPLGGALSRHVYSTKVGGGSPRKSPQNEENRGVSGRVFAWKWTKIPNFLPAFLEHTLSRSESTAQARIRRINVMCVRIDERPKDSETDAARRKELKSQYAELLKKALETHFKDLP